MRILENDDAVKNKLLFLIEEGDATVILSSEYTQSLNELIKYEFISIENDALRLTEKGKEAKIRGVKALMEEKEIGGNEIKISNFSQQKISSGISNRSFLIILFFFLISLLAIISLLNTSIYKG